jgi:hypothetical protein
MAERLGIDTHLHALRHSRPSCSARGWISARSQVASVLAAEGRPPCASTPPGSPHPTAKPPNSWAPGCPNAKLTPCPGTSGRDRRALSPTRHSAAEVSHPSQTIPNAQIRVTSPAVTRRVSGRFELRQTVRHHPSDRAHVSNARRATALPATCDKVDSSARQTNTHYPPNSRLERSVWGAPSCLGHPERATSASAPGG